MTNRIALGVIRKAHGVRGEASVEPWTDSPDRFTEIKQVTLVAPDGAERAMSIENVRVHGNRALIKFAGIESPEAAQSLQNWTLEIPESEARAKQPGEYFLHDLVGLTLIDSEGQERGVVTGIDEGGGGMLLSVRRADGRSFEVPFAAAICTDVDLENKKMTVNLPKGLDDLDDVED